MRNITLTREKTFVGCVSKLNVLIADPAGDITVNDTVCRRVAKIKNGETITFEIGDEATRIYVIADKLSKNYCNDYYPVPEGSDDLVLTGRCRYNPMAGNPYRFEGVTDPEVLANRRKSNNKGAIVVAVCFVIGIAIGLVFSAATSVERPETFSVADEFEITLTSHFSEQQDESGYFFGHRDCVVGAYSYDMGEITVQEFYEYFKSDDVGYFGADSKLVSEDGLAYVEDQGEAVDGTTRSYFCTIFKDGSIFYIFEFSSEPEAYGEMRPQFLEWAKTIKIK